MNNKKKKKNWLCIIEFVNFYFRSWATRGHVYTSLHVYVLMGPADGGIFDNLWSVKCCEGCPDLTVGAFSQHVIRLTSLHKARRYTHLADIYL